MDVNPPILAKILDAISFDNEFIKYRKYINPKQQKQSMKKSNLCNSNYVSLLPSPH